MAKQAGVTCIQCDFSVENSRDLYTKLVAISHWKEEDFQREQEYKNVWAKMKYKPDYIMHSFWECRQIVSEIIEKESDHK